MSETTRGRRIARVVLGTVLVAVVTVVLLFVVEGAASFALVTKTFISRPVAFMKEERVHLEYDEQLGWRHQSNLHLKDLYGPGADLRTNSQRMRATYDYTPAVPEGRIRVVCSGDSFTLGHSVGDSAAWCARLQQFEPRIESVNMGQAAYGVDQAFLWYQRDAAELAHDIQLFSVISTDFDRMAVDNFGGYPKPILRAVGGKLVVENVPVPRTMGNIPRRDRLRAAVGELRVIALLRALARRVSGDSAAEASASLSRADIEHSTSLIIEELKRLNTAKGSTLVLVFLPRPGDESFQWSDPWRAFIGSEAQRLGVPFVDLIPDIRTLPVQDVGKMYVNPFRPSHYNASGNEWVARLLLQRLTALRLLDRKAQTPAAHNR